MIYFHQAAYAWQLTSSGLNFGPKATTLSVPRLRVWHGRVEHWLRTDPGHSVGPSHFYGVFDDEAVLVRRVQPDRMRSARAWLLIGSAATLTPKLALELRDFGWLDGEEGGLVPLTPDVLAPRRAGLDAESRRPEALTRLTPLLSHFLGGAEGPIVLPPSEWTYPVLWGLQGVLGGLAADRPGRNRWEVSFETYDDRPRPPVRAGLFVRFQKDAAELAPHPVGEAIAERLVTGYGRQAERPSPRRPVPRVPAPRLPALGPLPSLIPDPPPESPPPGAPMPPSAPARPAAAAGKRVTCPICLSSLSWDDPALYRYDPEVGDYAELTVPAGASAGQRAVALRTAFVRCTDSQEQGSAHYLPLAYGQHGPPAVYGFVGATRSGKTHLLTAMIGQLEKHGLGLGLRHQPIGLKGHKAFVDEQVSPFLNQSRVIDQTRAGSVGLVDYFLIREGGREGRPIVLFDVAGGDLLEVESARRFLDVADGLIFVVNAAELGRDELGDRTFSTVLGLLEGSGRLAEVSAAVVLNKADLLRFEDPVAQWMRHPDRSLDADASLRESADVYAYLHSRGAHAWTRPYRDCRRATLHVASAAGSDAVVDKTFVRGVRPRRVLNPLISLMAMTGVLTSPEAQKVGI